MTSQHMRGWAAAGVSAGALAVSGCGSEESVAPSTTPAPAATAAATTPAAAGLPAGLRGRWRRTITARDWGSAGSGFPVGTWRLDVDAHGGVGVYQPGFDTVDFPTRFAAKGERLTIAAVPVCPGTTGRYTWHASADHLRLAVVGDAACPPRAALFGGTWTRRR